MFYFTDLPKNGDDLLRYLAQRLSRQRYDNVFDIDFDAYENHENQQEQQEQPNLEEQFHADVQEHLNAMAPHLPYVNGHEDNAVGFDQEERNLNFFRYHHDLLMPRTGTVAPNR